MENKAKKKQSIDFSLLLVTLLLVFIGLIMVFSSSWPEGIKKFNDSLYFFKRQTVSAILGLIIMLFMMNFNYKFLDKLAIIIYAGAIFLGALIFTPLAKTVNNATRWVRIGGFQFMPSDVIKIASIIFLSSRLRRKKNLNSFFKDLLPMLTIVALSCGLILAQKDLSTTVSLGVSLMAIIFVAGVKMGHILPLLPVLAIGVIFSIKKYSYRLKRLTGFFNPFENIKDIGWQASQGLMALGTGGFFGSGLGKSRQKFFYIPEAHNDFIFAIIGEELGFIGTLSVLLLISVLIIRGVRIAIRAKDPFARYLATGITALIAVQSLINIGVVLTLLPPTGIALPFISYGGTSLIINMASIGILLNISRYIR